MINEVTLSPCQQTKNLEVSINKMVQKTRKELQRLFKSGAKPSSEDFRDFIESTLNIRDDGLKKSVGADNPLKISAQGTKEKLLDFYAGETKTWSIDQKPSEENPGFNISTSSGSKLFIASSNGNVGIGTTSPNAKLAIRQTENEDALRVDDQNNDTTPFVINKDGNVGIGIANPSEKLQVSGKVKLQQGVAVNEFSSDGTFANNSDLAIPTERAVKTYVESVVVTGMIVMWSGASTAIPTGWALCNGVGGRPDLRDRFIMGAGANNNKSSGNATSHIHNINIDKTGLSTTSGGDHYHNYPSGYHIWGKEGGSTEAVVTTQFGMDVSLTGKRMTANNGSHSHQINLNFSQNSDTNSGEIKPKWYALCFIIRL